MVKGSRVQVMNGNADKTPSGLSKSDLKLNPKTGRYVSKAKSKQAVQKMSKNPYLQYRKQATAEVTKGRKDVSDLFVSGDTKIKLDVRARYEELLEKKGLPIKAPKKSKASKSKTVSKKAAAKTLKKRVNIKKKKVKKSAKKAKRGGWFY